MQLCMQKAEARHKRSDMVLLGNAFSLHDPQHTHSPALSERAQMQHASLHWPRALAAVHPAGQVRHLQHSSMQEPES